VSTPDHSLPLADPFDGDNGRQSRLRLLRLLFCCGWTGAGLTQEHAGFDVWEFSSGFTNLDDWAVSDYLGSASWDRNTLGESFVSNTATSSLLKVVVGSDFVHARVGSFQQQFEPKGQSGSSSSWEVHGKTSKDQNLRRQALLDLLMVARPAKSRMRFLGRRTSSGITKIFVLGSLDRHNSQLLFPLTYTAHSIWYLFPRCLGGQELEARGTSSAIYSCSFADSLLTYLGSCLS